MYLAIDNNYIQYLGKLKAFFNDINNGPMLSSIYGGVKILVLAVILFVVLKRIIKIIASGGDDKIEPYNDILLPIIYMVIVYNWVVIINVLTGLFDSIGDVFAAGVNTHSVTAAVKFDSMISEMFEKMKDRSFMDNLLGVVSGQAVLEFVSIEILEVFIEIAKFIEKFSLFAFWAFAQITLTILKLTGIIAFGLTMTGNFDSFKTWIKSYISVVLWVPFAFLVFYIIDQLYLIWVNDWQTDNPEQSFAQILFFVLMFVFFGLLKLVLMFKVPNMVSMVIGGGGGSGGIFGTVFAPVMMTTSAVSKSVKSVASGGVGAATGSAGAVASSKSTK